MRKMVACRAGEAMGYDIIFVDRNRFRRAVNHNMINCPIAGPLSGTERVQLVNAKRSIVFVGKAAVIRRSCGRLFGNPAHVLIAGIR